MNNQLIELAKKTIARIRAERPGIDNLSVATAAMAFNHDSRICLIAVGIMHRDDLDGGQ